MYGGLWWFVVGALIGGAAAQMKHWNLLGGIAGGALLGPLSFLLFFASATPKRKCPFCATLIQPEATVCPQCRRDLPPVTAAQARR